MSEQSDPSPSSKLQKGMLAQILTQRALDKPAPFPSPFTIAHTPQPSEGEAPEAATVPVTPRVIPRKPGSMLQRLTSRALPDSSDQRLARLVADNARLSHLIEEQGKLLHGPGGRWASAKLAAESAFLMQEGLTVEVRAGMRHLLEELTKQRNDATALVEAQAQVADLTSRLEAEQARATAAEQTLRERTTNNTALKRNNAALQAELQAERESVAALPALRDILSLRTLVLAQSGDAEAKAKVDSALSDLRSVVERIQKRLPAG